MSFSRVLAFQESHVTCILNKSTARVIACRSFHSNRPLLAGSPLLNLSGLSTSREAQHLSKEYRIPRTEFSPYLELIRSSEVLPFARTASPSGQDNGDQAPTSTGALQRLRGSRDHGRDSINASAKTVTATMKHLIDELAATRSNLQSMSVEKALLDSEVRRNNRDCLILSFLTMVLALALLFPDEYATLSQWAFGSKEKSWAATTKTPIKKRYRAEQEQEGQEWAGINTHEPDSISPATQRSPPSSPQSLTRLLQPTASGEGKRSETTPSTLSGYFWSSATSR